MLGLGDSLRDPAKGEGHETYKGSVSAQKEVRPEVVPCVPKLSHNIKNVVGWHDVPVVFSVPRNLTGLFLRILCETRKHGCEKKHARAYVKCATAVVHQILLSGRKAYTGQTGQCVNDRTREHKLSIENKGSAHLPKHCLA